MFQTYFRSRHGFYSRKDGRFTELMGESTVYSGTSLRRTPLGPKKIVHYREGVLWLGVYHDTVCGLYLGFTGSKYYREGIFWRGVSAKRGSTVNDQNPANKDKHCKVDTTRMSAQQLSYQDTSFIRTLFVSSKGVQIREFRLACSVSDKVCVCLYRRL